MNTRILADYCTDGLPGEFVKAAQSNW